MKKDLNQKIEYRYVNLKKYRIRILFKQKIPIGLLKAFPSSLGSCCIDSKGAKEKPHSDPTDSLQAVTIVLPFRLIFNTHFQHTSPSDDSHPMIDYELSNIGFPSTNFIL
ncbi:hypothetical protein HanXRQr2_Chr09g0365771 [Helianthus annuus]|uniref:Uncharacterized protein n=1 Tax=Helianthus annuus TaxID=4232 RepID=A0A9K3N6T8_HELAN|nr:hypothetical protein HanXRQr2_Chr09g0365771 [Helianthus annuus]KAJ0891331.1 hypothetical protein HanPSC8_Chr09g0352461 [Helianthus annuus]